jgi:hypothetical protein
MERSAIRDHADTAPDFAEPVITARAQLRSSSGAHWRDPLAHPAALDLIVDDYNSLQKCIPANTLSLFCPPLTTPGVAAGTHSRS